jgi:hypothetical protein
MSDYRNDIERLKALLSCDIMNTPEENSFDNLAKLVLIICNASSAFIPKKLPLENLMHIKIYAN